MSDETAQLVAAILTITGAATPLLLAATGELVTERAGVLNLGIEGMMLVGAIAAFATTVGTGSAVLGVAAAVLASSATALIFAVLVLQFLANQVATGLALTIFGTGLSALVGARYVGIAVPPLPRLHLPVLSDLPGAGPVLFGEDPLIYASILILAASSVFLYRTHGGLMLRAVGESHDAAHALGYAVIRVRYLAILFGGAMSGLGGAYMSLAYSPSWSEGMTAGRGWIALALVVFATWRPARLLLGAYVFGAIAILQLYIQAWGWPIPSQVLTMLPYLATVTVLVLISSDRAKLRLTAPACLGKPFYAAG
jgi:general nucleoside transport system permease protein